MQLIGSIRAWSFIIKIILFEAIEAYDKALEIDPNDAESWNNKGVSLGLLGRFDEALQAFGQATTLNSSYAEAWYNMGMFWIFRKIIQLRSKRPKGRLR